MKPVKYELGCYGDGAQGHDYTRRACHDIMRWVLTKVDSVSWSRAAFEAAPIMESLMAEAPDDHADEDSACEWLNSWAPMPNASWEWFDGDFGLWPTEEDIDD